MLQFAVKTLTNAIDKIFGLIATGLLFFLMILTFVDVLGRDLLNRPVNGAGELTEIALFVIIFLMLPQVTLRHQHIVIDVFDRWVGAKIDLFQRLLSAVLGAGLFGITGWKLWLMADRAVGADVTPSLLWPLAPFFYSMAIMSFVNAVASLLSAAIPLVETKTISVG